MEIFQKIGIDRNIKLRVHDAYSILSIIEVGLDISILPEHVFRKLITILQFYC